MKIRRIGAMLLALIMVFSMCFTRAFADNDVDTSKHTHGKREGATVSEEVDRADNYDNTTSTDFYLYCPPDPLVSDMENMGDSGLNLISLLWAAFFTGIAYMITASFARDYSYLKRGTGYASIA